MGNRIYVGNLGFQTSEDELRTAVEPIGTVVDLKIMSDRETGQSRGFGFVTFASDAEAQKAISELNGRMLDGRELRVSEAQERTPRSGGGGGGGRGGGGGNRW